MIHTAPDKGGRAGDSVYFVAAPVSIGGQNYTGVAVVKSSAKDRRLYVHEVLNEELLAKLDGEAGKRIRPGAGSVAESRGVVHKVLSDILSVKPEGGIPPSPSGLYWKSEYGPVPVPRLELPDWKAAGMPELVRLVVQLTGRLPEVKSLRPNQGGFFATDSGRIVINRDKAMTPEEALQILAHEFGHAVDYGVKGNADSGRVGSGNLLGRLAVLKNFRKHHLPTFPDSMPKLIGPVRDKLKAAAEADLRARGLDKPAKDDPNFAVWADAYAKRFEELSGLRDKGALAVNGKVRAELKELTMELRPWTLGKDTKYDAYRHSADELYADFFSALLASPGLAAERAPLEMQALLQGGDTAARDAGTLPPGARDFRQVFGELTLSDNVAHEFLTKVHRTVLADLDKHGVSQADLGLFMQHMRALKGDRAREVITLLNDPDAPERFSREYVDRVFNPAGIQQKDARAQVRELLKRQPNREARLTLIRAQRAMRDLWDGVVDELVESGSLDAEGVRVMREAARGFYAPFAVVDYFTGSVANRARVAQKRPHARRKNPEAGRLHRRSHHAAAPGIERRVRTRPLPLPVAGGAGLQAAQKPAGDELPAQKCRRVRPGLDAREVARGAAGRKTPGAIRSSFPLGISHRMTSAGGDCSSRPATRSGRCRRRHWASHIF